jgi:acyl-CoA reductase-like NAD-dependent aldehyde dehydrogenase
MSESWTVATAAQRVLEDFKAMGVSDPTTADGVRVENFIDNVFLDSKSAEEARMPTFCPGTGAAWGSIPDSGAAAAAAAVKSAKEALPSWRSTPAAKRGEFLQRIADLVMFPAVFDALAAAESRDNGKPVSLARAVDINRVAKNFEFFASAELHHEERSALIDNVQPGGAKALNFTSRLPVGVCGLISPWNLPLYLLTWKIAPALATGNTCVCKPSEFTSVSAWMLCSVLRAAGLPSGVLNMVFGRGAGCGAALVRHPDVGLISFTGGTATAEHIIKDSAPTYKKLYLELGGKNPNIVFDDADLDEAIPTSVRSSFANQGQICLCGSRLLVQAGVYDEFVARFVAATEALRVGDPTAAETTTGALVSLEHRDKVESMIAGSKEFGGKILTGGRRPDPAALPPACREGYYLLPTVIGDLPWNCTTQQEEIFGPVVGITKFETEEEAIQIANSVRYGLASSIWTRDGQRALRVSHALEAGTVWVNCWMVRDLRVPFGGFKHSGLGRMGGDHSLDLYTEQKNICMKF